MAYRSDIVIAMRPDVYENMPEDIFRAFKTYWDEPTKVEKDRVVFFGENIAWYKFDESDIIQCYLETLNEIDYAFIELGEDWNDAPYIMGDICGFNINLIRQIEV